MTTVDLAKLFSRLHSCWGAVLDRVAIDVGILFFLGWLDPCTLVFDQDPDVSIAFQGF